MFGMRRAMYDLKSILSCLVCGALKSEHVWHGCFGRHVDNGPRGEIQDYPLNRIRLMHPSMVPKERQFPTNRTSNSTGGESGERGGISPAVLPPVRCRSFNSQSVTLFYNLVLNLFWMLFPVKAFYAYGPCSAIMLVEVVRLLQFRPQGHPSCRRFLG